MSNAPLADRLRHAETIEPPRVDASTFRQGWRVRSRLDALLAERSISLEVWQAAVEYRAAYDRWQASGGGELAGRISGGADAHDRMLGLVDTLAVLAATERQIGRLATALCVACVVEDQSWPEIGRRCGRSHHTARAWTVHALRALAVAWATRRPGGRDGFAMRPEPKSRLRPS